MKSIRALSKHPAVFLLLLLAAAFGVYGFAVTRMGFYWDDWQAVFIHRLGDPSLFWSYFAYDRPVSAWTYLVTFPLFGSSPVAWQVFSIFLRWLTAAGFWWALRGLWPQHTAEVSWMALLFVLYPGFTQQSVSVAYSQHWIAYALFTFSLGWMIWSIRRPRLFWLFTVLSVLASLLQLLTMEYFAGLEFLRPFILWYLVKELGQGWKMRIWKALKLWVPYALAMLVFLAFRFIAYPRLSPDPGANTPVLILNWLKDPLPQTVHLVQIVLQDFIHMNLFAWTDTIIPENIDLSLMFNLGAWGVGLLIAVITGLFLIAWMQRDNAVAFYETGNFSRQGIGLGLLAIFLGGFPVWSTDRQIIVGMWSDRFSLAPMFGVVILLVSLLYWLINGQRRRAAVLALLVILSTGAQMRTVSEYRKNWNLQQNYYWQMVWRMPGLKPGTALLGTKMPFGLVADYSVAFASNIIYAPQLTTPHPPYWFLSALRYVGGVIPKLKDGQTIQYDLRTVLFEGQTDHALVTGRDVPAQCMRVYTQEDAFPPEITGEEVDLLAVTHPGQIIPDPASPAVPPVEIFGPEPDPTWCYYFEKADLARQTQNWEEITRLYEQAKVRGLRTKFGFELLPFVEAYAHQGMWQQAYELSVDASQMTASMEPRLCHLWSGLSRATPDSGDKQVVLDRAYDLYICR